MSDLEESHQEAVAIASDAPIDVDDLPSDAEASTSKLPAKAPGPGRPKGKSTTTASAAKGKDTEAQGLESFLLPKSTITKIAKSAVPPNTKLQKEVPIALTRSAVVFISYLTSLAQEQAAAAGVKTIKPDHVLDALPELDWGEADTLKLRKALKKQLKAFRAGAKAKKEGKPVPGPSTTTGRPRGRPPKKAAAATDVDTIESDGQDEAAEDAETAPEVSLQLKRNALLTKSASGDEEESSEDEDEDVNVTRIRGDGEEEAGESAFDDDIEEEDEEEEEEEDDDEEDIEDPDDVDPNDFEEDMGQSLDKKGRTDADDDMED